MITFNGDLVIYDNDEVKVTNIEFTYIKEADYSSSKQIICFPKNKYTLDTLPISFDKKYNEFMVETDNHGKYICYHGVIFLNTDIIVGINYWDNTLYFIYDYYEIKSIN